MAGDAEKKSLRERSLTHLKRHPNIYTLLCMASAAIGLYADYSAATGHLRDQSVEADEARVTQDQALQDNLRVVYEKAIVYERRIATLEAEVKTLKRTDESFLSYLLGTKKKEEASYTPIRADRAQDPAAEEKGDAGGMQEALPPLKLPEPRPVFKAKH